MMMMMMLIMTIYKKIKQTYIIYANAQKTRASTEKKNKNKKKTS